MGISLLSAFQIQENETIVSTYQSKESEKYGYVITHGEENRYRPIVSCNPFYDSEDKALTAGNELVKEIKKLDLSPQRKSLVDLVGGTETAKTIDSVIQSSQRD